MKSTEYSSFAAWISTIFVYFCYLGWAFLPGDTLHSLGITYYPDRYYAVSLPAYFLVFYVLTGISYIGYNMMNTLEPESFNTVHDIDLPHITGTPASSLHFSKCSVKEGIPDIGDIPIVVLSTIYKENHS